MYSTKNFTIGRIARLASLTALIAALAAAVAGQASAYVVIDKPQAVSHSTAAGLRADGLRLQAAADAYQNRPAASYYTPQALQAQGARWVAMAKAYERDQSQTVATSSSNGGFDWRDGLIGFAGAVGLAILAMGPLVIAARTRREQVPA